MQPTTLLCTGMLRSGSTWVFHVARHAMALADPVIYREVGYLAGTALAEVTVTPARYHRLVQCQADAGAITDAIRAGVVHRVIYCHRHPMAALASRIDQVSAAAPVADDRMLRQVIFDVIDGMQLGRRLRGVPGVLFLDPHADGEPAALDAVLTHLGLQLTPGQRMAVLAEHSFERLQHTSTEIGEIADENPLRGTDSLDAMATVLAAHGMDSGPLRDWTTELTVEQITKACIAFAEYGDFGAAIGPAPARGALVEV